MEIFIAVIGALLVIIGLLGTFIPMLPGTPVSYAGLLLLLLIPGCTLTWKFFLVWGIIVVVLQILNYFIPIWGVNKFGGTKYGQWGSVLGVIVGLFAGPLGIIVGPFVGAVIGELIAGTNFSDSLRAGFGSFLGTFIGMVLGIIVAAILMFYYFKEVFSIFF
ncbi:MAG: DUF456 domain-containing protein [Paludibacteraceae bacterium]|nr:DUF456 domain-containing protein [Paludibacteraceae bacterium]MBR2492138.1 DUF456 domain-containing protein [Paludibacteraceae bacterium]